MNAGKIIVGTIVVGGVGFLIFNLLKKANEADAFVKNIQTNVGLDSIKVVSSKDTLISRILNPQTWVLRIKVNISFFNPTNISVSFQKPYVDLKYKGTVLAKSKVSSDKITIAANGQSEVATITLDIPILSKMSILKEMCTNIIKGVEFSESNISNVITALTTNATALLPLLEIYVQTRIGGVLIPFTTKLG